MANFELTTVLRKSAAGAQAIQVRSDALSQKQRMMLIMIDGKKQLTDLLKLKPDPNEVHQIVSELVSHGFVEVVSGAIATASVTSSAPSPGSATVSSIAQSGENRDGAVASAAAAATPEERLAQAVAHLSNRKWDAETSKTSIRRATKQLESLLGPSSESLCIQIEKCKNADEFIAKILDLRRVVSSLRSEQKADEFVITALGV